MFFASSSPSVNNIVVHDTLSVNKCLFTDECASFSRKLMFFDSSNPSVNINLFTCDHLRMTRTMLEQWRLGARRSRTHADPHNMILSIGVESFQVVAVLWWIRVETC